MSYPKRRSESSQIRIAVVSVASQMIGATYRLGGWNPQHGFDCFSYWYYFYSQTGVSLPQEEGSYGVDNYMQKYAEDPQSAKAAMITFIRSLGETADGRYLRPGDFCLVAGSDGIATAIYVGSGNLISCDIRAGVVIFPKSSLSSSIEEVRRLCLKPCQL